MCCALIKFEYFIRFEDEPDLNIRLYDIFECENTGWMTQRNCSVAVYRGAFVFAFAGNLRTL